MGDSGEDDDWEAKRRIEGRLEKVDRILAGIQMVLTNLEERDEARSQRYEKRDRRVDERLGGLEIVAARIEATVDALPNVCAIRAKEIEANSEAIREITHGVVPAIYDRIKEVSDKAGELPEKAGITFKDVAKFAAIVSSAFLAGAGTVVGLAKIITTYPHIFGIS